MSIPGQKNTGENGKEPQLDCESTEIDPVLAQYLKEVDEEKKSWLAHAKSLKKQYTELKRDVSEKKKINVEPFNFIDYLPEEEKSFFSQLQSVLQDHTSIKLGIIEMNKKLKLIKSESQVQKLFMIQQLDALKDQFNFSKY